MSKRMKFDPTLNTIRHVKGSSAYQSGMRKELDKRLKLVAKYIHRLKTQEFKMQDAARVAESKRIDESLKLRDEHDLRMSNMILARSEATDSAVAQRLDRLEQFMFTQSGKGQGISNIWAVVLGLATIASAGVALYAALH